CLSSCRLVCYFPTRRSSDLKVLFFSHCRNRYKYGEEQRKRRSRFLDEVTADVVRTETGATINQSTGNKQNGRTEQSSSGSTTIEYDWKKPLYKKKNRSSGGTKIHYDNPDEDPFQAGAKVEH